MTGNSSRLTTYTKWWLGDGLFLFIIFFTHIKGMLAINIYERTYL